MPNTDAVTRTVTDVQVDGNGNAVVGVRLCYRGREWLKSYRLKPDATIEDFENGVAEDARKLMNFRPVINRIGKTLSIPYDDGGTAEAAEK